MEGIQADLVVAAWPEVGQAAVQDAVNFVPLAFQEKLEDPRSCLLPLHEWPVPPPQSNVRASDEEWHKVVKAAYGWKTRLLSLLRQSGGKWVHSPAAAVRGPDLCLDLA